MSKSRQTFLENLSLTLEMYNKIFLAVTINKYWNVSQSLKEILSLHYY